ncbi:hypothetical protein A1O1_08168 [Capronia coronata CBS 617.96]|uniref:Uncharacterized protein n=1 Tax=Capronia coronata CBS 617.96 TaxID=1182541 RepID=W9YIH3_9EURO|nr:uncharacterized protein A1O1_08168 [Capronia coronata CBS 617.96]EXJ82099.1 hypothetical protein A1O1_08168 [Capronia coronata CBS 617.96]
MSFEDSPSLSPDISDGPPHHGPKPPPGFLAPALNGPHPGLDKFSLPFQSIVNKLKKEYMSNPSDVAYIKAIHALDTSKIRLLAKEVANIQPLKPQERRSFINGARKGLASADGKDYMKEAATAAGNACNAINGLFTTLRKELKEIDDKMEATGQHVAPFEPLLKPLQRKFKEIIANCKTLSSKVSILGKEFNTSIIAYAKSNLDTPTKETRIDKYIVEAKMLSQDSASIQADLDRLPEDFSKLMDRFHDFSKQRQPNFHAQIEVARQRLDRLDKKLKDLKLKLTAVTASAGVVGTLAGALAGVFPPASAFILASGLLATAGLGVYAAILAAQIEEIERDKQDAKRRLDRLTAADAAYREATTALEQLGLDSDETFTSSIDLVLKLLGNVTTDAESIKEWLSKAGDDEALPEVMGTDLKEAGDICTSCVVSASRASSQELVGLSNTDINLTDEAMSQYLNIFENML